MKVFSVATVATAMMALAATQSVRAAGSSDESSAGTVSAATSSGSSTSTTASSGSAANDFMSSLKDGSSSAATAAESDSYHMTPVHVVQARVQSDEPAWNAELERFVSKYYDDATYAFVGLMDTVNTASVEGALMYVQAEGINYDTRSTEERCTRKNDMTYVVFYEYAIAQTNETLALYQDKASQNEYGNMLAMDSGRCTPSSTDSSGADVFPEACYYFNGDEGQPEVGPFIGGTVKATDARAPYPNNVWYSFPNTCPLETWSDKTDKCRASTRQGLCDVGVMPDGVSCTFNYRVLGFILIDDLVGITSMVSNTTGETYANFSEFCENGGVEFEATEAGEWIDGIEFWENPQDEAANSERATKLVEAYYNLTNGLITTSGLDETTIGHMLPLPSPAELAAENPACYLNVKKCNSDYGCYRELYGNTCTVCNSTSDSSDCETAPSDWTFPTLEQAVGEDGTPGDANADSSTSAADSSSSGDAASGSSASASAANVNVVSAVLATTLLALASALLN